MNYNAMEVVTTEPSRLVRATVGGLLKGGEIVVCSEHDPDRQVLCDFLQSTAPSHHALQKGDLVLVMLPADSDGKGCVLGKIGPYRPPEKKHVEIVAEEDLTIRCGKSSIMIKKSGKILIKGVEIVSHARQGNRIRGASIKLN